MNIFTPVVVIVIGLRMRGSRKKSALLRETEFCARECAVVCMPGCGVRHSCGWCRFRMQRLRVRELGYPPEVGSRSPSKTPFNFGPGARARAPWQGPTARRARRVCEAKALRARARPRAPRASRAAAGAALAWAPLKRPHHTKSGRGWAASAGPAQGKRFKEGRKEGRERGMGGGREGRWKDGRMTEARQSGLKEVLYRASSLF